MPNIENEFEYKRLKQLIVGLPNSSKEKLTAMLEEETKKKEVYGVRDFAERISVPESTVRRWLKNGEVRGVKRGKLWLIPASELEKILEAQE